MPNRSDLKPAKDCQSMEELRAQIDQLDMTLVQTLAPLLIKRASYIDRAITLKQENGWPARIPERVDEVIENAAKRAQEQGLDPDLIRAFWRELVNWSIAREDRIIGSKENKK